MNGLPSFTDVKGNPILECFLLTCLKNGEESELTMALECCVVSGIDVLQEVIEMLLQDIKDAISATPLLTEKLTIHSLLQSSMSETGKVL